MAGDLPRTYPPRPMPRRRPLRRHPVAGILIGAALLGAGCSQEVAPPVSRDHVVIVLIDQLRKDAADAWMPRLNALAEGGVRFEQMRSAAPWTYPSVISLMTGLYPQVHGADGALEGSRLTTFDPDLPLLPKLLREDGYETAAFVANPFLQRFNSFHENFDHYDISFVKDLGNLRGPGSTWGTPRMFADSLEQAIFAYFDARPPEKPEFTYVHYIDVHGPWDGAPFSPDYESAVRFVDEHVARLYHYLDDRYQGRMLFLVTADHGRALGDDLEVGLDPERPHLRVNKKSMHEFNLRIPLMVLPGVHVDGPRSIHQSCSNVDVVPTVLEWLGIPEATPVSGQSLMPVIRGEEPDTTDRPIYARNDAFGLWTDAMIWRDHKYIRYFRPDGEIAYRGSFDLEQDPREVRRLRRGWRRVEPMLEDLASKHGIAYEARYSESDPTVVEQLQALGYLRSD
jgi:arylsulfatase A-like enzyme